MAKMSTPDLLELFEKMTVLELKEFLDAFEERFEPLAHLRRRGRGEGEGEHGVRGDSLLDQPDEAAAVPMARAARTNPGTLDRIEQTFYYLSSDGSLL